jgi:hypothetical protein
MQTVQMKEKNKQNSLQIVIHHTFDANPSAASSVMVVCLAPGSLGPQGIHISPSFVLTFLKCIASWVLRTGSKSTSFTCTCKRFHCLQYQYKRDSLRIGSKKTRTLHSKKPSCQYTKPVNTFMTNLWANVRTLSLCD